ncbi:MAG TPA: hypothetical protein VGV40_01800 [Solirubrobacteraceae bacterium]|nr:hypothetical protein [Solirubrobacteraceae bacterium]
MRRAVALALVLAALPAGLTACGGDDIVDATPRTQPDLTVPGGSDALTDEPPAPEDPAATTPGGVPPGEEGVTPGDGTPGQEGAAPGTEGEFDDFCAQNPGACQGETAPAAPEAPAPTP